jgi:hypothetical protein
LVRPSLGLCCCHVHARIATFESSRSMLSAQYRACGGQVVVHSRNDHKARLVPIFGTLKVDICTGSPRVAALHNPTMSEASTMDTSIHAHMHWQHSLLSMQGRTGGCRVRVRGMCPLYKAALVMVLSVACDFVIGFFFMFTGSAHSGSGQRIWQTKWCVPRSGQGNAYDPRGPS